MSLQKYKKKRNFDETSEPEGKNKTKKSSKENKGVFVVQKHDASRLHYDFRLEIDGVLKSWAVPKGPSLNPEDKRLAVETEDHPLDYKNFEGTIPEGHYGAGKVLVWDKGNFKNIKEKNLKKSYEKGQLEFELKGKKLKGKFALVKTKLGGKSANGKNWLLIKMKDDFANKRKNILNEDKSVKSGKKISEV